MQFKERNISHNHTEERIYTSTPRHANREKRACKPPATAIFLYASTMRPNASLSNSSFSSSARSTIGADILGRANWKDSLTEVAVEETKLLTSETTAFGLSSSDFSLETDNFKDELRSKVETFSWLESSKPDDTSDGVTTVSDNPSLWTEESRPGIPLSKLPTSCILDGMVEQTSSASDIEALEAGKLVGVISFSESWFFPALSTIGTALRSPSSSGFWDEIKINKFKERTIQNKLQKEGKKLHKCSLIKHMQQRWRINETPRKIWPRIQGNVTEKIVLPCDQIMT